MVTVTINNRTVQVPENTTILKAAEKAGIEIPYLCYWEGLNEIGACRVCVVEVEGFNKLFAACNNVVQDGMVVHTNSEKVRIARRNNVRLILSEHDTNCTTCVRSGNCRLQDLANDLNILDVPFQKKYAKEMSDPEFPLIRDESKCVKCMRCIQVCDKIQSVNIWDVINRGTRTTVGIEGRKSLKQTDCVLCGQCIIRCPVGALRERDDTEQIYQALQDPEKIAIAQIAPAVRAAWGEYFGLTPEKATMERLAACLHAMGFQYVFDTDFSADLTIMEEANELLHELKKGEDRIKPFFTSCCPGWIRFAKTNLPELLGNISTSKSPQQMFGAIVKSYYAKLLGTDPKNIFCVSFMPCLAKKEEAALPTMKNAQGIRDVDVVLTVRELNRILRAGHINVRRIKPQPLDAPLGTASGAGVIFGTTGGVMEAALRTAYHEVTGNNPDPDAFRAVRGLDGWKDAEFEIAGTVLKVAVVNGLSNVRRLLAALKKGEVSYDFIEVMACPGGCVGGGGTPIHEQEMAGERAPALYELDHANEIRFSHENPAVLKMYQDYLGEPLSELSENLLHTDHTAWNMH